MKKCKDLVWLAESGQFICAATRQNMNKIITRVNRQLRLSAYESFTDAGMHESDRYSKMRTAKIYTMEETTSDYGRKSGKLAACREYRVLERHMLIADMDIPREKE